MRRPLINLKIASMLLLTIICGSLYGQARVANTMYAHNAWYLNMQSVNTNLMGGKWKLLKESGVRYVRIGGIEPGFRPGFTWDQTFFTVSSAQMSLLRQVIDSCRAYGMEPIIQVGYNPVCTNTISPFWNVSRANQAVIAGELVKRVNKLDGLNVEYWIIGNEPDHTLNCFSGMTKDDLKGYGYSADSTYADTIAFYTKSFAAAMKNQDSTIKIIGPEFASFGNDWQFNQVNRIMNWLLSNPSNSWSIMGKVPGMQKYYVDMISWHYYAMYQMNNRDSIISAPGRARNGFRGSLNFTSGTQWKGLISMITNNNTQRDISNLKIAVTEMNAAPPGSHPNETSNLTGVIQGYDSRSFLGGQFWADVYSQAMSDVATNPVTGSPESWVAMVCPWSVAEGSATQSFGYLRSDNSKRPTYHHYKLLAEHIKGVFYMNQSISPTNKKIKAFASVEHPYGVKVMILNQDNANDYHFRINFSSSNTGSSPNNPLTLNFNFAADTFLSNKLTTNNYLSPRTLNGDTLDNPIRKASTIVLWFTCEGTLFHRTDYTEDDAIAGNPPQITQLGDNVVNADMISCSLLPGGIGGSISGNVTYGPNAIIPVTSDITLTPGSSLTFNRCLIVMSEGTKITGSRQNSVTVKNSIMVGCQGTHWEGIQLSGFHTGESLIIDSTIIVNADTPVYCKRIPNIEIKNNWIVNGSTAIYLEESKDFTIRQNNFGAFEKGINTESSQNATSQIHGNRFIAMDYPMYFSNDNHSGCEITCNAMEFRQTGILSDNSILNDFGSSTLGAGNRFKKTLWPDPSDYLDMNGGNSPTYYYGPGESVMFPYSSVMNITSTQVSNDRDCAVIAEAKCEPWPLDVSVKENFKPLSLEMSVFPNPGNGKFNLELNNGNGKYTMQIHDLMGRVLERREVDFSEKRRIEFQIQAKGMYIVTLQNAESRITGKVIVE